MSNQESLDTDASCNRDAVVNTDGATGAAGAVAGAAGGAGTADVHAAGVAGIDAYDEDFSAVEEASAVMARDELPLVPLAPCETSASGVEASGAGSAGSADSADSVAAASSASASSSSVSSRHHPEGPLVLFTAGSVLRGDDAVGPLLAKNLMDAPLEGWEIVDGGQTPEDDLYYIRELCPRKVVFVDAAQMGFEPGSIRRLTAQDVAKQCMITTHSLPISFLLGQLGEVCDDVVFLGVQVKGTEFFDPLSDEVRAALEDIERTLRGGESLERYESLV